MVSLFARKANVARVCLSLLIGISSYSLAQESLQAPPLDLQDAIVRSLHSNPDLKAFAYELEAQLGRVRQAGARRNPEVNLLVENALGTGVRSGINSAETTLSMGFLIEHDARQRRIDAARASSQLLEVETTVRRLDVAAEATRRYLAILDAQAQIDELDRAVQLGEQTLAAVQARVRSAKAPQAEEARAYAQLAQLRVLREEFDHGLAIARQRMAALWGERNPDFGAAQGSLLTLPTLQAYEVFVERLERNPTFEQLLSERRLREAEVRVAESRRRSPWEVTAGVRRFEDQNDHALVLGFNVPLPNRNLAEGAVATARAQAAQIDARHAALRAQLDSELFALYQQLRHSYEVVQLLRDDVLPRMEVAVEQSRYAYERGRYGYIEWVAAQRELLDQRRALLEASTDAHRVRIEIERLTGAALSGGL